MTDAIEEENAAAGGSGGLDCLGPKTCMPESSYAAGPRVRCEIHLRVQAPGSRLQRRLIFPWARGMHPTLRARSQWDESTVDAGAGKSATAGHCSMGFDCRGEVAVTFALTWAVQVRADGVARLDVPLRPISDSLRIRRSSQGRRNPG